uniref:Peptidoglycan binding-like domain-containing protein n=1 Tax=Prymnesium polylepis TaxID=72548 RepID=A0A7S4M6B5_9EUKA
MMMRRRSRSFSCGRSAGVSASTLQSLEVDGVFGAKSTMALQAMLSAEGLKIGPIDGRFGRRTKRALQSHLKDKGYEFGPVDGWFGRRSIRAFQTWVHDADADTARMLGPIDGRWGRRTTSALQTLLNGLRDAQPDDAKIPNKEDDTNTLTKPLVVVGQVDVSAVQAPEAAGAA